MSILDQEIPCPLVQRARRNSGVGKGRWGPRSRRVHSPDEQLVENVMDKLLYDLHYAESCYEQVDHLTDEQRSTLARLLEIR